MWERVTYIIDAMNCVSLGGRSTPTAQALPKKHRVRNVLLAIGGTGSLYVAYRIYYPPSEEVRLAKNWQVS